MITKPLRCHNIIMEKCKQNQTVHFHWVSWYCFFLKVIFDLKWVVFNIIASIQVKPLLGTKTIVMKLPDLFHLFYVTNKERTLIKEILIHSCYTVNGFPRKYNFPQRITVLYISRTWTSIWRKGTANLNFVSFISKVCLKICLTSQDIGNSLSSR